MRVGVGHDNASSRIPLRERGRIPRRCFTGSEFAAGEHSRVEAQDGRRRGLNKLPRRVISTDGEQLLSCIPNVLGRRQPCFKLRRGKSDTFGANFRVPHNRRHWTRTGHGLGEACVEEEGRRWQEWLDGEAGWARPWTGTIPVGDNRAAGEGLELGPWVWHFVDRERISDSDGM
jgi:hypothetical protein